MMRFLSSPVDYAVNALCYIAARNSKTTAHEIQKELGLPPSFTREIMRQLGKAGILTSLRGNGGGFRLAMPPEAITVRTVLDAFEPGNPRVGDCALGRTHCPRRRRCRLRHEVKAIGDLVRSRLQEISIQSLICDKT